MGHASASQYKVELLDENDGFASSIVFSIVQDKSGFLWFGTAYSGLMRYDGKNIVHFQHATNDPNSLPNNNAGNLLVDKDNNVWVGSWGGGALRYNQETMTFKQYQYNPDLSNTVSSYKVQKVFEDQQGNIWLGTLGGGLNKFNPTTQDFTRFEHNNSEISNISYPRIWDIAQTSDNNLLIATDNGLNLFDKSTHSFTYYLPKPDPSRIEQNRIRRILASTNNTLFLGTQDGVLIFESDKQKFTPLPINSHLSIGPIYSMIKTNFGQYWVSSDLGIFAFSDDDMNLKKVDLGFDDRCSQTLFQDKQGIIWLSCEGTGVYKITRKNTFNNYDDPRVKAAYALHIANDGNLLIGTAQNGIQKWNIGTNQLISLSPGTQKTVHPDIRFLTQTSNGDIWYGNFNSVFKLDTNGVTQRVTPTQTTKNKDLFNSVRNLSKDEQDNIWVATSHGIFVIRSLNSDFEHIPISDSTGLSIFPETLYLDRNNQMWIGTNRGLYLWNKQLKKVQYFSNVDNKNVNVIGHNYINYMYQDTQQRFWVSTYTGLHLLNQETGEFSLYEGYFSNRYNRAIRYISEDQRGMLWLVTTIGVSKLNPLNGDLQHFDNQDGLPGSRYYYNPTSKASNGTIYLSSREGIYYFDPDEVTNQALAEETRLTNFEILGSNTKYNSLEAEKSGVILDYDQNNIRFEFATLDFLNARQIQYSYKLDGFDNDWIENGNSSSATYTNLGGGDYTFRVRASIKNEQWYKNQLAINLHIKTPFWLQWWMFVFYGCLALWGIYYYLQRQRLAVIKFERQVAEKTATIALESSKLASANQIKTKFLANMSHEIRTPLTTVIGQAEAIICREIEPEDIYKEVEIIHDSSLYLLDLLNDILDLTKIEENKFELERAPQDLHALLKNINTMFSLQAKAKGLSFSLIEDLPTPFIVNVDSLRLKQILINLCSNAIKFTLKGYVTLKVSTQEDELVFDIEDTGIGISDSQVRQIFESFTQGDSSIRRRFGGSGLGLHLSAQLATLMDGKITVKSELNKGSVFTFSVPIKSILADSDLLLEQSENSLSLSECLFSGKILLAEDHPDNRRLVARLLTKLGLTVYTAKDGIEAVDSYLKHSPNMVLLDIQMPNMDGIEAFKSLRKLNCTVPIIALTANAMTNEIEQYMALGFDGYIQKPLQRDFLIAMIAKHFSSKVDEVEDKAVKSLAQVDMSDLVIEFKASLFTEKQQLILHGAGEDLAQLAKQAHSLCGAAQLFGFQQLSDKAAKLENSIKNHPTDTTSIKHDLQSLLDEIETILA